MVAALTLGGARLAAAQGDALAAARAADTKIYYPQDHGLRDVRADIMIEAKSAAGETEVTRLRYLWKSPGCERWMSLGERPALVDSPDFFDAWAVAIVRRPLVDALAGCRETSVRHAGNGIVIQGIRGPENIPEQVEITVTKGLLAKLARKWRDRSLTISDFHYEKRGGAMVPTGFRLEIRDGKETARIDITVQHRETDGFWLPESITIKSGRDSARLLVDRCQVNEGVPELECETGGPPSGQ
jgi:hypothetical protein